MCFSRTETLSIGPTKPENFWMIRYCCFGEINIGLQILQILILLEIMGNNQGQNWSHICYEFWTTFFEDKRVTKQIWNQLIIKLHKLIKKIILRRSSIQKIYNFLFSIIFFLKKILHIFLLNSNKYLGNYNIWCFCI